MKCTTIKTSALLLLTATSAIFAMEQPPRPHGDEPTARAVTDADGQTYIIDPTAEAIIAAIDAHNNANPHKQPVAFLGGFYGIVPSANDVASSDQQDVVIKMSSMFMRPEDAARLARKEPSKLTEFQHAARTGDLNKITALMDQKIDINGQSSEGYTALHFASRNGFENIVELLLARKANVFLQSYTGRNALHFAAAYYQTRIAEHLIKANISLVNSEDHHGNTPLHTAAIGADAETVVLLLRNGALMKQNGAKQNPLDAALLSFEKMNIARIPEKALPPQCKPNQTLELLRDALKKAASQSELSKEKHECAICICEIDDAEVQFLSCAHRFHKKCAKEWLNVKSICPTCNAEQKEQ